MARDKSSEASNPLDGDWVYGMKVSDTDGDRVLAKRRYAMEFGIRERVQTATHPEYPGVSTIKLFDATPPLSGEPLSLEAAMASNPYYQHFLLSLARPYLAVVTSRINYDIGGRVTVLPGSENGSELEVDMYDAAEAVNDHRLIQMHIGRVASLGGNPMIRLPQTTADQVFRHIISRAPERL